MNNDIIIEGSKERNSYLDLFFKDYFMALWSLLLLALLLNIYGVIDDNQYFVLTTSWSPPLLILLPLLAFKPELKDKIFTPIIFIITTFMMFIFNTLISTNKLTIKNITFDYFITLFIGLGIILIWIILYELLSRKTGRLLSSIITSIIIIGSIFITSITFFKGA